MPAAAVAGVKAKGSGVRPLRRRFLFTRPAIYTIKSGTISIVKNGRKGSLQGMARNRCAKGTYVPER